MRKVAIISAILEYPEICQTQFNTCISEFCGIIKGRMGIPLQEENMAAISVTVVGSMDEINTLTGRLGKIEHVLVKTAVSKIEIE